MTILQGIRNKIYDATDYICDTISCTIYEASFYVYTYIYSIDRYIHNRAY